MKIYVDGPFKKRHQQYLRNALPEEDFTFKTEIEKPEDQLKTLLEADILLGNPKPADVLQKAMNLKWVQLHSTGFDIYQGIRIPAMVTNMKDYYAQPCAETVIAGIMSLYRGMDRFTLLKEQHQWLGYSVRSGLRLLRHKRVIILGAGSIGKHIHKILQAFDCDVRFFARSAKEAVLRTPEQLLEAIPSADIIIGCLPGTEQTRGLFTTRMIHAMHSDAIFCNVGRGNLLEDENELVAALKEGKIGGAVLDVSAKEPLPADHPLWDCPNTVLSQHTGGGNKTEIEGILDFFLINFRRFKSGQPLLNMIQLEKGY